MDFSLEGWSAKGKENHPGLSPSSESVPLTGRLGRYKGDVLTRPDFDGMVGEAMCCSCRISSVIFSTDLILFHFLNT